MGNKVVYNQFDEKPNVGFIKTIFGKEIEFAEIKEEWLSSGIQLIISKVLFSSIQNDFDEKAYLNFYPIEDDARYLQLSFFSEYNLNTNEDYYVVTQIIYHPYFFEQWSKEILEKSQPFQFDRSAEQAFSIPACSRDPLNNLLKEEEGKQQDFTATLRRQEIAIFLLRIALEAFFNPDESNRLPACSFLSNTNERKKVMEAHSIIMNQLDNPVTIRELSRMVGINECYLKKGFKAMFGKTIHELTQYERIEASKSLLKKGNYSINEVAYKMGFGSASHFSTTFKKVAGMKPCELLG